MSVERIKGEIVFTCDDCDDFLETSESDFQDARLVLQRKGWSTRISGSSWHNECPDCQRIGAFKPL